MAGKKQSDDSVMVALSRDSHGLRAGDEVAVDQETADRLVENGHARAV